MARIRQSFIAYSPQTSCFQNVEKHFAVVGVLEEMDMSLRVLETYIPKFFAGIFLSQYSNMFQTASWRKR